MKPSHIALLCAATFSLLTFGCKKSEAEKAATISNPVAVPASTSALLSGTVLETMDASNYTYVRVKTDKEVIWAAASQFKVKVGDKVTVPADMPMKDFNSPSLKRTFPTIYFTSHIYKEGEVPGQPAGQ